jgi:hypothetical protein
VRARAATGGRDTMADSIELAFTAPVDAGIVIDLAGYLNRDTRLAAHVPAQDAVRLLLEVGRRLGDPAVPGRSRRDVPRTWKDIMRRVLNRASDAELIVAVYAVPELDAVFATHLLSGLPARYSPARWAGRCRRGPG